ncbi:hypothetical protein PsAD14_01033 [Pseudovibrio sp. Ad14]|nr:hypothetical protein PsW74_02012 [Pseudovibrio sp. W74]KZL11282.1 hypothetical protein PsAD14_01033 [Pseudovibrio sp. Ad14]
MLPLLVGPQKLIPLPKILLILSPVPTHSGRSGPSIPRRGWGWAAGTR